MTDFPKPPFPDQPQPMPGETGAMNPPPDHGEESPIWTPLIPSTMPPEKVKQFGSQVPMKRPGQPSEVAPLYVLLASAEASYVSGATFAVTGGKPML